MVSKLIRDGAEMRRNITKKADRGDYKDVFFSILHEPPSVYGINRTRWEMAHLKEVMAQKGSVRLFAMPDTISGRHAKY